LSDERVNCEAASPVDSWDSPPLTWDLPRAQGGVLAKAASGGGECEVSSMQISVLLSPKHALCRISDHRTLAINLSTFLLLALTLPLLLEGVSSGTAASLVIDVFRSVFAWEASGTLATSRETTPPRDLLHF
jgi:hypothetical protein